MIYKLTFQQNALKEHGDIVLWYKQRSRQAGENFIAEFDETAGKICRTPFQSRNPFKNYREVKMKKYPYYIIFRIDENNKKIVVVRIYHTSRNPENKYRKLY